MIKIDVLTPQTPLGRYAFNDFYPLLKWEHQFRERNIRFRYFKTQDRFVEQSRCVAIIDYRYLNQIGDRSKSEREQIIDFVNAIRRTSDRLALFDSGDSTGSRCFWLTPHVDVHLKKQLLRDRSLYVGENMTSSYMIWIPNEIIERVFENDRSYVACPEDQLYKLALGWNIAMCDYRAFPLERWYPIGKSGILNRWYRQPKFIRPNVERPICLSYRGSAHGEDHYMYQRGRVQACIDKLATSNSDVVTGGKIPPSAFRREMQQSRIVVSPFGWGEICYRDFEAMLYGAVLVKPGMDHLETFPDLFKPNVTYIPVSWELDDLESVVESVERRYSEISRIAVNAQKAFESVTLSFEDFCNHFLKSLSLV